MFDNICKSIPWILKLEINGAEALLMLSLPFTPMVSSLSIKLCDFAGSGINRLESKVGEERAYHNSGKDSVTRQFLVVSVGPNTRPYQSSNGMVCQVESHVTLKLPCCQYSHIFSHSICLMNLLGLFLGKVNALVD